MWGHVGIGPRSEQPQNTGHGGREVVGAGEKRAGSGVVTSVVGKIRKRPGTLDVCGGEVGRESLVAFSDIAVL